MLKSGRLAAAIVASGAVLNPLAQANAITVANNVVAAWIQLGPGSSAAALNSGGYGDVPVNITAAGLTPTILARAVINGGACPALTVDGTPMTMNVRFTGSQLTSTPGTASPSGATNAPAPNGYPNYPQYFVSASATSPANFPDGTPQATTSWGECEAVVPAGHTTATIGSTVLKLPVANPQKILVIADTGCRMSNSSQQSCHNVPGYNPFPFAQLAAYEALFKPDLIVQVGDWFYRDTDCQLSPSTGAEYTPGCSNPANANYQTWGDTFDSWNADVIFPGAPLLAAAPWVMTRGNHESCGRGARGWYALLDPHPFNLANVTCAYKSGAAKVTTGANYSGDFEPSYAVPAGAVNLIVHDSSYANDSTVDANMATNYDYDLTSVLNQLPNASYNILVTHKPAYGLVNGGTPPGPENGGDVTEQYTFAGAPTGINSAFYGGTVPYKLALFLSGHIHQLEYVNFQDYTHYAPQLVVGVGGTNLDTATNAPAVTYGYQDQPFVIANSPTSTTTATVSHAYSQAEFGFALLQATPTGYIANVYNTNSNKAGRCTITLNPRNIACWE